MQCCNFSWMGLFKILSSKTLRATLVFSVLYIHFLLVKTNISSSFWAFWTGNIITLLNWIYRTPYVNDYWTGVLYDLYIYAPMFDVLKWCVPTFGWEQPIVTLPKIVWEILKKTVYRVPLFSRSQETAVSHVRTNLPNAHKGQVIFPGLKHMSI